MRIYAGFCLSECACISAGVGAYPVNSNPRPGQVWRLEMEHVFVLEIHNLHFLKNKQESDVFIVRNCFFYNFFEFFLQFVPVSQYKKGKWLIWSFC